MFLSVIFLSLILRKLAGGGPRTLVVCGTKAVVSAKEKMPGTYDFSTAHANRHFVGATGNMEKRLQRDVGMGTDARCRQS